MPHCGFREGRQTKTNLKRPEIVLRPSGQFAAGRLPHLIPSDVGAAIPSHQATGAVASFRSKLAVAARPPIAARLGKRRLNHRHQSQPIRFPGLPTVCSHSLPNTAHLPD